MKLNGKTEIRASSNACGITANAVYHLMGQHIEKTSNWFVPEKLEQQQAAYEDNILLDHMATGVVHPITQETITKYEKLAQDPIMKDTLKQFARNWVDSLRVLARQKEQTLGWKFDRLPRGTHHLNSRPHHGKNTVEQHPQHARRKIWCSGCRKLLFSNPP
eukprot:CCRYP_000973-RA/>CCRYP_000973-RA protein AED:0.45 eAED:0.45 QI:0/0/0/1/0/0/2/0/160